MKAKLVGFVLLMTWAITVVAVRLFERMQDV